MLYQEHYHDGQSPAVINATACLHSHNDFMDYKLFPWHCHAFYELQYCYDAVDEEHAQREGVFRFYAPFQPHTCNDVGYRYSLMAQFSPRFIRRCVPSFPEESALVMSAMSLNGDGVLIPRDSHSEPTVGADRELREICRAVPPFHDHEDIEAFNSVSRAWHTPLNELRLNGALLRLVLCLLESGILVIASNSLMGMDSKLHELVTRIIANPGERLPMRQAAELVHMSYSDFSRTFKVMVGYGYSDFCNMSRISQAEEILRFESIDCTEIAERLNFGSASYFNRIFRRFTGVTPTEYKEFCKSAKSDYN